MVFKSERPWLPVFVKIRFGWILQNPQVEIIVTTWKFLYFWPKRQGDQQGQQFFLLHQRSLGFHHQSDFVVQKDCWNSNYSRPSCKPKEDKMQKGKWGLIWLTLLPFSSFPRSSLQHSAYVSLSKLIRMTAFHFVGNWGIWCFGLEINRATHSSVLAWRIPGVGEPGGLPSMGSHRIGHDWSDLAAAAAKQPSSVKKEGRWE